MKITIKIIFKGNIENKNKILLAKGIKELTGVDSEQDQSNLEDWPKVEIMITKQDHSGRYRRSVTVDYCDQQRGWYVSMGAVELMLTQMGESKEINR